MVHEDWIEQKLMELEDDRNRNIWSDVREHQLAYLRQLHKSGEFAQYSAESIIKHLVLIFHGI